MISKPKLIGLIMIVFFLSCAPAIMVQDPESKSRAFDSLAREMQRQNWDNALDIVNAILDYSPLDCSALHSRMIIYEKLDEEALMLEDIRNLWSYCDEELQYLVTASELLRNREQPGPEFYIYRAIYYKTGEKEHKNLMETALKDYSVQIYREAVVFLENDDRNNALEKLDKITDINPEFLHAYRLKAEIFHEVQEYEKGIENLLKLLEMDDKNERDLLLYADMLYQSNETYMAYLTYKRIVQLYPFNAFAEKRLDQLKMQIERDMILQNLMDNLRAGDFVRTDELSALMYFKLYEFLYPLERNVEIIIDINDNTFKEHIEFLVFRRVFTLTPRRAFGPERPVTRAILARAFYNILGLLNDFEHILKEQDKNNYKDINKYHIYFDIIQIIDYYKLIDPDTDELFDITQILTADEIIDYIERLKELLMDL